MFQNYTKRLSLTSYNGNSWFSLTGFEVIANGIPNYYVVDQNSSSKVVMFDQNWNYQNYSNLLTIPK
jgi:hypothetical protein